jgi:tetratricopeptide (TPR) repeat protein
LLIKKVQSNDLDNDFIRREILPFIAEAWHIPGASSADIAAKIDDKALAQFISELDADSFMPHFAANEKSSGRIISREVRSALKNLLKKLYPMLAVLICFAALSLDGGEIAPAADHSLFNSGKYKESAEYYHQNILRRSDAVNTADLCNMGNALFKAGEYGAARAALEAAHRFDPRNKDILRNLNIVNRKVRINEVGKADSIAELAALARDFLRPDEHLLIAAVLLAVIMIIVSLYRIVNAELFKWITIIAFIALIIEISAVCIQLKGPYDNRRAVICAEKTEVHSLPSVNGSRVIATLDGGNDATVLDRSGDMVRINSLKVDGWVKKDQLKQIFNGKDL